MNAKDPRRDLTEIFDAAVKSVDPYRLAKERIRVENGVLSVLGEIGGEPTARSRRESRAASVRTAKNGAGSELSFDLDRFDRILVAGAGKASGRMARALEELLGERISGGCVAVKELGDGPRGGPECGPPASIKLVRAGHPLPDENSVKAAEEIMGLARGLSKEALERTLLVVLLSGGGSSLLVSPLRWRERAGGFSGAQLSAGVENASAGERRLTLADIRRTTDALLSCGAPIQAMNCVRKHLSNITGGKLARLFHPAEILVLILSDVVGDRLDTIASGPTVPDDTTYGEALRVIRRYGIENRIPECVLEALKAGSEGRIPETPKRNDPAFERVRNVLIGSNRIALAAAAKKAAELGYDVLCLSSMITGEAREAAKVLYGIALEAAESGCGPRSGGLFALSPVGRPACILWGGETTVTLKGTGKGGRNQEFALSFLAEMMKSEGRGGGIRLLSASTDGTDGPTDAAGAFASPDVLAKCVALGLDPADFLADNDSHAFFSATGAHLITGPTGTNVCDLQIVIVP